MCCGYLVRVRGALVPLQYYWGVEDPMLPADPAFTPCQRKFHCIAADFDVCMLKQKSCKNLIIWLQRCTVLYFNSSQYSTINCYH